LRYFDELDSGDDDETEFETLSELPEIESEMLFELYENEQARLAAASAAATASTQVRNPAGVGIQSSMVRDSTWLGAASHLARIVSSKLR
jgi:hypothetical protein